MVVLLLFLSCLWMQAQEVLVIHLQAGGDASFALAQQPVITLEGESMVVKGSQINYSVPISDVAYYHFAASGTDIQQPQMANNKPVISNGHVQFSGLAAGSRVCVYTIDGKQLGSYRADDSGCVDVDVTTLSKGIYVLKSPTTSIKITNR